MYILPLKFWPLCLYVYIYVIEITQSFFSVIDSTYGRTCCSLCVRHYPRLWVNNIQSPCPHEVFVQLGELNNKTRIHKYTYIVIQAIKISVCDKAFYREPTWFRLEKKRSDRGWRFKHGDDILETSQGKVWRKWHLGMIKKKSKCEWLRVESVTFQEEGVWLVPGEEGTVTDRGLEVDVTQ